MPLGECGEERSAERRSAAREGTESTGDVKGPGCNAGERRRRKGGVTQTVDHTAIDRFRLPKILNVLVAHKLILFATISKL